MGNGNGKESAATFSWPANRDQPLPGRKAPGPVARHAAPTDSRAGVVTARPGAARPATWPLVADDMFRLAHRDHDGSPLLHPDVAAVGLAAALLAELVITDRVRINGGRVTVWNPAPPADPLARTVLEQLWGERVTHPVRTWLTFLARTSYDDVGRRLLRAGHVAVRRRRWGWAVRYVPVNMNTAAWPWARLSDLLRSGHGLDGFDTVLGGLVLAMDLHRQVLLGDAGELTDRLRATVTAAPAAVRELLCHTEAAAGDAVITH
jgi:hypothetical protein